MQQNMTGILFQSTARARAQSTQAELARQGLGDLGNPMILFLLSQQGRDGRVSSQRELADALHVSPATVAVSLRSLERGGYVEKRCDPEDQRRKSVVLTPKGEGAFHRCLMIFELVDRKMLDGFTDRERELLGCYLARMIQNLRGEYPVDLPFGKENDPC